MSRPDVEPMVREIWERTPNGCGHRQVRMRLVHEFGTTSGATDRERIEAAIRANEDEIGAVPRLRPPHPTWPVRPGRGASDSRDARS